MTKQELLHSIQVADFALVEANLFLDAHPNDANALQYFEKYKTTLEDLTKEYVSKYGPLLARQYEGWDRWKWVDGPFPWQNDANR